MGRRHTNQVHNYFSFDEQWNVSKCHICNNGVKGKHGTNLLRHLSTRHPNVFCQVKFMNNTRKTQDNQYDGTFNTIASISDTFSVKRNKENLSLLNECVNLVTIHGRPLKLFDDKAFQNIIKLIPFDNADRVQINSYKICKHIKQQSKEVCQKISEELHNKIICLKVDVISHFGRTFVGIHAQYINEDITVLRTLSISKLDGVITSSSLEQKIFETLRCYNMSIRQIYTVTTDDLSNATELASFWPEIITAKSVDTTANVDLQELDFKLLDKEDEMKNVKILLIPREEHMLPRHRIKQEIDVANVSTANSVPIQKYSYMVTAVKCTASILDEAIKNARNNFCENQAGDIDVNSLYPTKKLQNRLITEQMTCGDFYGAWMMCVMENEKLNTPLASEITKSLKIAQKRLFENSVFLAAIYLDPRFNIVLSLEEIERARSHLNTTWVHMLKFNSLSVSNEEECISDEDEIEIMLRRIEQAKKSKYPNDTNEKSGFDVKQMSAAILGFTNQHRVKSKESVLEFWQSQKISNPYLYKLAMTAVAVPTTHVSAKVMISSVKFILLSPDLDEELLNSILLIRCNENI